MDIKEGGVRKEVAVAFSKESVTFSTVWSGLMIWWAKPKLGLLCPFPPRWGPTLLDLFRKYHFCFVNSASKLFGLANWFWLKVLLLNLGSS